MTIIGLDNGLAPNRRHAIIWTNVEPICRRINAALVGDGLMLINLMAAGVLLPIVL